LVIDYVKENKHDPIINNINRKAIRKMTTFDDNELQQRPQ